MSLKHTGMEAKQIPVVSSFWSSSSPDKKQNHIKAVLVTYDLRDLGPSSQKASFILVVLSEVFQVSMLHPVWVFQTASGARLGFPNGVWMPVWFSKLMSFKHASIIHPCHDVRCLSSTRAWTWFLLVLASDVALCGNPITASSVHHRVSQAWQMWWF